MLHLGDADLPETVFQLKGNSTKLEYWWKSTEPLWTTATQNGLQVFLDNFANCDVPVNGTVISPGDCTGYEYHDFRFRLRDQLNKALSRFRQGYSLAMVRVYHIKTRHKHIIRLEHQRLNIIDMKNVSYSDAWTCFLYLVLFVLDLR